MEELFIYPESISYFSDLELPRLVEQSEDEEEGEEESNCSYKTENSLTEGSRTFSLRSSQSI